MSWLSIALLTILPLVNTPGDELIKGVFQQRKTIETAAVFFELQKADDTGVRSRTTVSYWQQANKVRFDRVIYRDGRPPYRVVLAKNCFKPDTLFVWNGEPRASGKIGGPQLVRSQNASYSSVLPDMRLLGCLPVYFDGLHNFSLHGELGSTDRSDVETRPETTAEGRACTVVSFRLNAGSRPRLEYWLSASMPANVLRITCNDQFPDGSTFVQVMEIEPGADDLSKWSFPRKYRFVRRASGKPSGEEIVTVTQAAINRSVDEAVFNIQAIGLPDNTEMPCEGDGLYIYKEGKLTRKTPEESTAKYPIARFNPTPASGWLTAALIGFAITALASLAVLVKLRWHQIGANR